MNTDLIELSLQWASFEEGCVLKPYRDSSKHAWLTIGKGRNLEGVGLRNVDEADYLCRNDIRYFINFISQNYSFFERLDLPRQLALINFCFAGEGTFSSFKKTLEHLKNSNFSQAAKEFLNSLYAAQVPGRARRIAAVLRTGELPPPVYFSNK